MLKFFKVNEKGFTAVELIIALAVSLLVVAAAGFIVLTQSGVIRFNRSVSTEQQRLNIAFNTVRDSLRMAGFDYGQGFYAQSGSVLPPPVQVVDAAYPTNLPQVVDANTYLNTNPYEVLVSYSSIINGSNPCLLTPTGTTGEFNYSGSCPSFVAGQGLIINPLPAAAPCIAKVTGMGMDGMSSVTMANMMGGTGGICGMMGGTPGTTVTTVTTGTTGTSVFSINQVLFYWGNQSYGTQNLGFNPPFNIRGNLYECQVAPVVISPAVPTCAPNTTITLSGYINNFTVTPPGYVSPLPEPSYYITSTLPAGEIVVSGSSDPESPYLNLSIMGESNVALSDSPAYSINVPYNSNAGGALAKGKAGQIVGNNVLKTLNSSVFLRNVKYGS